jgi:hypothetical protein
MKALELINILNKFVEECGNLEVAIYCDGIYELLEFVNVSLDEGIEIIGHEEIDKFITLHDWWRSS